MGVEDMHNPSRCVHWGRRRGHMVLIRGLVRCSFPRSDMSAAPSGSRLDILFHRFIVLFNSSIVTPIVIVRVLFRRHASFVSFLDSFHLHFIFCLHVNMWREGA